MNHPTSSMNPFGGKNAVRIIPSPAGIVQATRPCKTTDIREGRKVALSVERQHMKPNDVRQSILMIREKFDVEATVEEMMNLFCRFADRIRPHRPEIIRLGSQPDNPLVDHGREIMERLIGADMRNANNIMLARNELLRIMDEEEEFIRNYIKM
ncbi:hypothetical protein Tco_0847937 [Tanacetum coccineum]